MNGGVLFDLDDTLLDRQASVYLYGEKFYEDFEPYISEGADDFLKAFVRLDGNGYVPRDDFFRALARYIGRPEADPGAIADHFAEQAWTQPVTMNGAVEVLSNLQAQGVPIGVITNGGSFNQRKKLRNSGLETMVDEILISEECGIRKPDPEIFLMACRRLGVSANDSWFVGDNPTADIIGANRVGCRTVWLKRAVSWPEAHPLCCTSAVETLAEAFDAIQPDP
ncbi:MAG: HAD family hydrolase [Pseudomonadales bacterium]